jgi:hypothetical protein
MCTTILVAADARWVRDQVRGAFVGPDQRVVEVTRGQEVRDAVKREAPDLVVLDLQIGNMGGGQARRSSPPRVGGRLPRERSCSCSTATPTGSSAAAPCRRCS